MTPSKTTDDAFPKETKYEKRVGSVKRAILKEARENGGEGPKWDHSDVRNHLEKAGYESNSESIHHIMFDLGSEDVFADWFEGEVNTGTHWLECHDSTTKYILDVTCDNGYEFSSDPQPTREKAEGLRDALLYGDGSSEIEIREVEQ